MIHSDRGYKMSSVKILLLRDLDARGKEDSLALDSMPNFQRLVGPPHRYGCENNCCNSGNDLSHTLSPQPLSKKKGMCIYCQSYPLVHRIHFRFGVFSSLEDYLFHALSYLHADARIIAGVY